MKRIDNPNLLGEEKNSRYKNNVKKLDRHLKKREGVSSCLYCRIWFLMTLQDVPEAISYFIARNLVVISNIVDSD
jgi:hypothetical protein